jgi:integrase
VRLTCRRGRPAKCSDPRRGCAIGAHEGVGARAPKCQGVRRGLLLLALAIAIAAIEQLDAAIKGRGRRRRGKPQLRIDEARRFQAACLEHADRDVGAGLALGFLLLAARARAGEIVLRELRDVDDGGRVLWIPDSKTQAGRREFGVPEPLAAHLARLVGGRLPGAPLLERR